MTGAVVVVGLALVFALSDEGFAQSRERLLGTFATTPSEPQSGERGQDAAQLLAEAIGAIDRGDVMLGRRWLEAIIQRYPDTLAAATARRELASLFPSSRADADDRYGPRSRQAAPPAPPPAFANRFAADPLVPPPSRGDDPPPAYASPPPPMPSAGPIPARQRQTQDERRQQALGLEFQTTAGDRVFFPETSADLGAHARTVLRAQARWLAQHPEAPVTIEAHADDLGSRELDVRLAERRGIAVRERLIEEGIEPARISMRVFGRDRPVANCNSPECAAQNRRVVTRVGSEQDSAGASRGFLEPAYAGVPRSPSRGYGD